MTTAAREQIQGRPIIFGEVLFDHFPDSSSVLGGAPFNVAWHLRGFGLDPLFVSRVGADAEGERVLERMQDWGMDRRAVQRDARRPTGAVKVSIRDGQPSFDIVADQAYDHIAAEPALEIIAGERPALLYFGSLIARAPVSRQSLESLRVSSALPAFVDINLRPPWWDVEVVARLLQAATWLKLNDHELSAVLDRPVPAENIPAAGEELRRANALDLLVVTVGAEGAYFFTAETTQRGAPHAVDNLVDTVGAGDAFSSVVVLGLLAGWPWPAILERALEFAARICTIRGATTFDTDLYRSLLQRWTR